MTDFASDLHKATQKRGVTLGNTDFASDLHKAVAKSRMPAQPTPLAQTMQQPLQQDILPPPTLGQKVGKTIGNIFSKVKSVINNPAPLGNLNQVQTNLEQKVAQQPAQIRKIIEQNTTPQALKALGKDKVTEAIGKASLVGIFGLPGLVAPSPTKQKAGEKTIDFAKQKAVEASVGGSAMTGIFHPENLTAYDKKVLQENDYLDEQGNVKRGKFAVQFGKTLLDLSIFVPEIFIPVEALSSTIVGSKVINVAGKAIPVSELVTGGVVGGTYNTLYTPNLENIFTDPEVAGDAVKHFFVGVGIGTAVSIPVAYIRAPASEVKLSPEELTKIKGLYGSLAKKYHPDSLYNGDAEAFKTIKQHYDQGDIAWLEGLDKATPQEAEKLLSMKLPNTEKASLFLKSGTPETATKEATVASKTPSTAGTGVTEKVGQTGTEIATTKVSKPITVFHGTPTSSVDSINKNGLQESPQGVFGKGYYFATSKDKAMFFAKDSGKTGDITVVEQNLKPGTKIFKFESVDHLSNNPELNAKIRAILPNEMARLKSNWVNTARIPELVKSYGYDGIEYLNSYRTIYNPDVIEKVQGQSAQPKATNLEPAKTPKVVAKETKVVEVPRSQMPIGEGREKVSRLEARVKQTLNNLSQEQIDSLGLSTYKQMNNADTIAKASEYVINNPEDALKVLKGELEVPKGLNPNSIYVAMSNNADGNFELATKLATYASTAAGQNIEILKELNPNSPVKVLSNVYKIREKRISKQYPGKTVAGIKKNLVSKGVTRIKAPTLVDWGAIIEEVRC